MTKSVVSGWKVFSEKFPKASALPADDARVNALKRYFEHGGVVSVHAAEGVWPRLGYPTPLMLRGRLEEYKAQKARFAEKHRSWSLMVHKGNFQALRNMLAKFGEPL